MKNEVDDVNSLRNDRFDSIVRDSEAMQRFKQRSNDYEKIAMYKYVLVAAKEVELEKSKEGNEMIPFYWLASMELEQTEAIRKYLNKEITDEMIAQHELEQKKQVEEIVRMLQERKAQKRTLKYQVRKFLGLPLNPKGRKK